MNEDNYFEYLNKLESNINKKINISLYTLQNYNLETYLVTKVEDQGEGFDTRIFSNIFGVHKSFNGRGVFIAKKSTLGIYYSNKGNIVYFFIKL
jgi:light-regulated signal transduction histidine kinase (bacteriophytochrome)